jgi:hypothetical protein
MYRINRIIELIDEDGSWRQVTSKGWMNGTRHVTVLHNGSII